MINIHDLDKKRCITALLLCSLVSLIVFFNVVFVLTYIDGNEYIGTQNMRYFTYEANTFVGIVSLLCIPFQIEGLRHKNYHLPRWLVNILFVSVCAVTVTFLLAMIIIVPTQGFYYAYVYRGAFLPHFVTPLLSIITFIFINDDHEIHKSVYILALIPLLIYIVIYLTNVFVIDNWIDHYGLRKIAPIWVLVIGIIVFYMLVAILLRKLHNKRHKDSKMLLKKYYTSGPEVSFETIDEAISNLAIQERLNDKGGDLVVPRRIIILMEEKYKSGKSLDELCNIYINSYLNN